MEARKTRHKNFPTRKRPYTGNPIGYRERVYRKKYGITTETYEKLLERQSGVCAICKMKNRDNNRLSVDHCHKTNKVRGLLCRKCNIGIGFFDDSIEKLEQSILYLKPHVDNSFDAQLQTTYNKS